MVTLKKMQKVKRKVRGLTVPALCKLKLNLKKKTEMLHILKAEKEKTTGKCQPQITLPPLVLHKPGKTND